jgi:type II secretory pathway component GspD/PulD (secretin)
MKSIAHSLFVLILMMGNPSPVKAEEGNPPPMTIQTVPLKFVTPADVLPSVEPLVQPHGRVTVNRARNELVVMASEEKLELVKGLVEALDKMPVNVSIQVEMNRRGTSSEREASLSGQGKVVIVNGKVQTQATVNPTLINRETGTTDNTIQTLMVMSGRGASLRVGEEIPYPDYFYNYGLNHGYVQAGVQWQQVGSSLYIEPTVIGDGPMVKVRVTPEVRALVNGRLDSIRYASTATEVMARSGESIRIGGQGEHQDFYSRFLIGRASGGSSSQLDIILTPQIQKPMR